MTQPSFATQRLDHFGIVAGICDRIDLIETIDTFVGQTRRPVSVGETVIAMILNALCLVAPLEFQADRELVSCPTYVSRSYNLIDR